MEKCPICGMEVSPQTAPRSEFKGKKYYFCCEECKQEFDKNPERYVKA